VLVYDVIQLRVATMEANRAANLVVHAEEIASRPARQWFQSARQKADTQRKALEALRGAVCWSV
jgi:ATP-dependent RNA helicase DDX27